MSASGHLLACPWLAAGEKLRTMLKRVAGPLPLPGDFFFSFSFLFCLPLGVFVSSYVVVSVFWSGL